MFYRLTKPNGDLRQFVYLDEVALRSLMASRYGPAEVKSTDSLTRGMDFEKTNSFSLGNSKTGSIGSSDKFRSSSSTSRQVERQTTVQSLFRDFLERERIQGGLTWNRPSGTGITTIPYMVKRGNLLELQVELAADPLYRIGALMSEASELAKILPQSLTQDLSQIEAMNGILERLMVGQIPLRSRITNASYTRKKDELHITSDKDEEGTPLNLVATTDLDQYWTDTRRVLFGKQKFTMLVRVIADGPTNDWSAIKLLDMMKDFLPGLDDPFRQFEDLIIPSKKETEDNVATPVQPLSVALREYGRIRGFETSSGNYHDSVTAISACTAPSLPNAESLSIAFDDMDELIDQYRDVPGEESDVVDARNRARLHAGIDVRGNPITSIHEAQPIQHKVDTDASETAFIECEVIAIYW